MSESESKDTLKQSQIKTLIESLPDAHLSKRKDIFNQLVEIGRPAVQPIIESINQSPPEIRRELAQILGEIRDPSAIPALIELLEDDAFEVRWRAAESLIEFERACLIPLLEELRHENRFGSPQFLEGSHHILRALNEKGYLGPSVQVLEAFNTPYKEVAIPWAAEKTLECLKGAPDETNVGKLKSERG